MLGDFNKGPFGKDNYQKDDINSNFVEINIKCDEKDFKKEKNYCHEDEWLEKEPYEKNEKACVIINIFCKNDDKPQEKESHK